MPLAVPALCDYYGCLPRLVRHSAVASSACVAAAVSSVPPAPHAPSPAPGPSVAAHGGDADVPSTYTLSKPLVYPLAELPPKPASCLRLVVISDTHERHREMTVPNGDVLVHCGDVQEGFNFARDAKAMLTDFAAWFTDSTRHPHPVKLIIAGNHDRAIAAMSVEEVRRLLAPAVYLWDESVVVEPAGVRFYGSPRSIANSRLSPNKAFQGKKAWRPFMFASAQESDAPPASDTEARPSPERQPSARVEGAVPGGPVDVLMVHQSPDVPPARHTVEEQPICTYAQQVAPRRVLLCGHLHGAHGMHRLPTPAPVKQRFGVEARGGSTGHAETGLKVEEIPFLPCINAAMMMGGLGHTVLLSPSVVDLEV